MSAELLRHAVSEKDFQAQVVKLAKLNGFLCFHTFDSRRSEPGFPDLLLARPKEMPLFVELKTGKGRMSGPQKRWRKVLEQCPGADYRLWTPDDWPEIEETLRRRK